MRVVARGTCDREKTYCLQSKTRSRRHLLLHCVSENLEAAARKPQTNIAFESAGFAFVSSTSPTEDSLLILGILILCHPLHKGSSPS